MPLLGGGHGAAEQRDLAGQPQGRRDDEQREQRQPPRQRDHRDGGGHGRGQVRGDRRRGRGDDALHPVDVVGEARLHLATAGAREEAERLALQVREHRGAQLVHHPLPDLRRQPGLHDAEQLGHDRDGDHRADGHQQQPRVLLRQRDVDHLAHEEGLRERDDAGHDDDRDDDGHPQAVRPEEREHPRQGHRGLGELGAVPRVDAHRATATAAAATAAGCRGVGCAGGAGEGGGHRGAAPVRSVGRGERVWVRVAVMRTPPLGRELVVRSLYREVTSQ